MGISDKILKDLKAYLSEERFNHTERVEKESIRLGKAWNLSDKDLERVRIASLLHDLGKSRCLEVLLGDEYHRHSGLIGKLNENGAIYHAHVSLEIAKVRYGIRDKYILSAIRYHTTGREGMDLIEKIVYLADYIEPGRDFAGLDKVRQACYSDIDKAMLMALDGTIVHIIEKGLILNQDTVNARNSLITEARVRSEEI